MDTTKVDSRSLLIILLRFVLGQPGVSCRQRFPSIMLVVVDTSDPCRFRAIERSFRCVRMLSIVCCVVDGAVPDELHLAYYINPYEVNML